MDITFNNQVAVSLRNKNALVFTINNIFQKENQLAEALSIVFCSDEYLLKINQEYLKHDTYTDIISFNYASKNEPVNGELYISMDRVRENASLFNTSIEAERARVIFHGALHFCSFKDKNTEQKELMRNKEDKYLKIYFKAKIKH